MVKMSDILKKIKEGKVKEERPLPGPTQPLPETQIPQAPEQKIPIQAKPPIPSGTTPEVRISSIVVKEARPASHEETVKLYEETVSMMRVILKEKKDINDCKFIDIKRITEQAEKIVEQLVLENENLLMLSFNGYPTPEEYFPYHSVNVCIYSIEVGLGLHYEKPSLIDIGISSLLHDVGMTRYLNLAYQPRKLDTKELNEIKKHPDVGRQILENIISLNNVLIQTVSQVASQEHERLDGSGYPKGLKQNFINEYARIVSIVDVYEAMMHPRPYRSAYLPSQVFQEIMADKDKFDHKIIKVLVGRVGLFPIGSYIELNTKEIAQVVKVNREYPTRPTVKVIRDAEGNILKEPKTFDLMSKTGLYVKRCISLKKEAK